VVALAAVLNQRVAVSGRSIAVVLTGSNIDAASHARMIGLAGA
jgi:threonine dehydratase